MDQNILRLHIPVNDFILLHVLEGKYDLFEDKHRLILGQTPFLLLNELIQTSAVAKFQKYVKIIGRLRYVQHLNDMLVIKHLRLQTELLNG